MPEKVRRKTDNELEAAAKHVRYEIRMLLHSSLILGTGHGSPMIIGPAGYDKNMALESFLLHYRNLRAFLCPEPQLIKDDDILASDFLDATSGRNVGDATKLETHRVRLNKTLAHLSYARNEYKEPRDYHWKTGAMSIDMLTELENFVILLPSGRAHWFPRAAELARSKSEVKAMVLRVAER